MAAALKLSRRQRLDEEYRPLYNTATGDLLCQYGPSLITVIFNVQTIVDATLFFISGAHKRYKFTPNPTEDEEIVDVKFINPRLPSFFTYLLPSDEESPDGHDKKPSRRRVTSPEEQKTTQSRARKRCAFFNIIMKRRARTETEPPIVNLSADVKLFHYTAHVCGLRDARDAELVMRVIHQAFVENQLLLDRGYSEGEGVRKAFLESNTRCCTVPLVISPGDVVMTNICGRFPKSLNLRVLYQRLSATYPGVLAYLTTMSKSNYLAVTLFEDVPLTEERDMKEDAVSDIRNARHSYLLSSKKQRSKSKKHTFFIYASGRFIQSSRNNNLSLVFTEHCMSILYSITTDMQLTMVNEDEETEEEDGTSGDDE